MYDFESTSWYINVDITLWQFFFLLIFAISDRQDCVFYCILISLYSLSVSNCMFERTFLIFSFVCLSNWAFVKICISDISATLYYCKRGKLYLWITCWIQIYVLYYNKDLYFSNFIIICYHHFMTLFCIFLPISVWQPNQTNWKPGYLQWNKSNWHLFGRS